MSWDTTKTNISGVTYDPDDTTHLYAEDWNDLISNIKYRRSQCDAMVYQDGTYTVAVDSEGDLINKVLSSTLTDDIPIQAALDSVDPSGEITISSQTFHISNTLLIPSQVTVSSYMGIHSIGDANDTQLWLNPNINSPVIQNKDYPSANDNIGIFGISIYATKATQSSGHGILLSTSNSQLSRVKVFSAKQDGIRVIGNLNLIDSCQSTLCDEYGFNISSGDSIHMRDCYSEGNVLSGYSLSNLYRCRINDCISLTNGVYGIYVGSGVRGLIISGCDVGENTYHGIYLDRTYDSLILGNTIYNNGQNAIILDGSASASVHDIIISGNIAVDDQASPTQDYFVSCDGYTTNVIIYGNNIVNNPLSFNTTSGSNIYIYDNLGYLNQANGSAATITAGNTYVDVTHGLASTPTKVIVTPTSTLGSESFWVDTKGATTFRINITGVLETDATFDWLAEI